MHSAVDMAFGIAGYIVMSKYRDRVDNASRKNVISFHHSAAPNLRPAQQLAMSGGG